MSEMETSTVDAPRDSSGQFTGGEEKFGLQGVEVDQGFTHVKTSAAPPADDSPEAVYDEYKRKRGETDGQPVKRELTYADTGEKVEANLAVTQDAEHHARSISAAVARQIGPPAHSWQGNLPAEFVAWCKQNSLASLPARPASIALFVLENGHVGIDELARMVVGISRCHLRRGQADPTSGYPVSAALNHLAEIDAPVSWPKEMRPRFSELTYALQQYLAASDREQTRMIKRAHQEAADARKKLKEIEGKNVEAENVD